MMDDKERKAKEEIGINRMVFERGKGNSRLDLPFLDQDGLVLLADMGGDLDVRGPVGFADDFGFFRRGLA